jgi:hypothetical protein
LCRFIQVLLKTKVARWKVHFPPRNLQNDPCAAFFRTDDALLEVRNWKGEYCA